MLRLGINYELTEISQDRVWRPLTGYTARVPLPDNLQSLEVSASYSQKLDDRWTIVGGVGIGSHVAESGLLSEGWGLNARLVGLYRYSPTLMLAFGVGYDSLPSDLRVIGFFGFNWKIDDRWTVSLGFPRTGVSYRFDDRLTLAFAATGARGTYHVEDDPQPGAAPRSLTNSKLEQREIRLGLEATWKFNDALSVSGTVGHVVYRQFEYIDRDYELESRDLTPFLGLSARLRL
jgi:long-subunit fatty acid transport protein